MKKKIFVVEDSDKQRDEIRFALSNWGFEVFTAKTVSEARDLATQHWKEFDVAILDMRLEDPEDPHITGADIGIEFRNKNGTSPECIIFSAYAEVEYYKLAIQLGTASYLDKYKFDLPDLIRHVKAVALRKALSVENPETLRQITRIVTHSSNRIHAIKMFCQKVFATELQVCLGTPFFLIVTTEAQSEICGGTVDLPKYNQKIYHNLQAIAQAENNNVEPKPLDLSRLPEETKQELTENYALFQNAIMLPIFSSKEHKVSITLVLLKEEEINLNLLDEDEFVTPPNKQFEDPIELWKVLNQYLKPTVVEHLLTIFSEWNHIKTTLREISQICIWIGQEQSALLRNTVSLNDSVVSRLRAMADDLTESGNLLRHIEKPLDESIQYVPLSAKNLLNEIWDSIREAEESGNEFLFTNNAECFIEAQENDLYVVFSRLLQWLVMRRISISPETEPIITVSCESRENETSVTFTDKSKRLNETIRKELFVPFTQSISIPFNDLSKEEDKNHIPGQYLPLYIAKMIVEVKYGGEFIDATDDLEGNLGHKFILRFTKDRLYS